MPIAPKICAYCGDWFECRDHIIPICSQRSYRDYRTGETVPCCDMCNRLAGDFPAENIRDKAIHLIRRYEEKYARVIRLPVWTEKETGELKGSLRRRIRTNDALRKLIRLKLLNLDLVTLGFEPEPIDKKLIIFTTDTDGDIAKAAS